MLARDLLRKHCWLEEGTAEGVPPTSDEYTGALGERIREVVLHLLHGPRVDERPHRDARLSPRAHLQLFDLLDQLRSELVIDAIVDIEPIRADAGLPRVAELRCQRTLHGRIDVCVLEHDERRVPAKF